MTHTRTEIVLACIGGAALAVMIYAMCLVT